MAAPDARGLEFDAVIIVGPDEIQGESDAGLRDLYVAQTRATKRLIVLTIAPAEAAAPPTRGGASRTIGRACLTPDPA